MTDRELFAAVPEARNTKGLGKRQKAMLAFIQQYGLVGISRDSTDQAIGYSLIARQLVARPDNQCDLGYINQLEIYTPTEKAED